MALSTVTSAREAAAIAGAAEQAVALLRKIKEVLEHNSDMSHDWAAGSTPAYIEEDADGNINGLPYSRTDVANAVGTLDQIRKAYENEAVTQGDHLGNLHKLSVPSVTRVRISS